jgi:hypothetical protein
MSERETEFLSDLLERTSAGHAVPGFKDGVMHRSLAVAFAMPSAQSAPGRSAVSPKPLREACCDRKARAYRLKRVASGVTPGVSDRSAATGSYTVVDPPVKRETIPFEALRPPIDGQLGVTTIIHRDRSAFPRQAHCRHRHAGGQRCSL